LFGENAKKTQNAPFSSMLELFIDLDFFELVFTNAAIGAYPIVWQVFKSSTGGDVGSGITELGVVNVSTGDAFVFVHYFSL
jgi:hypothetical protein